MGLTFNQLKQGIQDFLENSAASFITATGAGKAPIEVCIELAELRIAKELELDPKEPYVIIDEVVDNNSFIAKKTKTFDEEKKVANKAPVDSISINDLNNNSTTSEDVSKKEKLFNYSIKIADFYYLSTAKDMNKRIKSEIFLNNS